jgi:hypothetical protein
LACLESVSWALGRLESVRCALVREDCVCGCWRDGAFRARSFEGALCRVCADLLDGSWPDEEFVKNLGAPAIEKVPAIRPQVMRDRYFMGDSLGQTSN